MIRKTSRCSSGESKDSRRKNAAKANSNPREVDKFLRQGFLNEITEERRARFVNSAIQK